VVREVERLQDGDDKRNDLRKHRQVDLHASGALGALGARSVRGGRGEPGVVHVAEGALRCFEEFTVFFTLFSRDTFDFFRSTVFERKRKKYFAVLVLAQGQNRSGDSDFLPGGNTPKY
jgi:hypothetical protein